MAASSRIQLARRRLKLARYAISAVALSAFAAFGLAVRDAHPATHTSGNVASSTSSAATDFGGSADFGPAPQTVAPQVQSSGS